MAEPDARKGGRPLNAASPPPAARLSRVKLFLALSRTPHGMLDLATPALAAALFNRASTYPLGLMCALIPLVGAIGAYGAELTFPVDHE